VSPLAGGLGYEYCMVKDERSASLVRVSRMSERRACEDVTTAEVWRRECARLSRKATGRLERHPPDGGFAETRV
jgi:hypothetical protein